MPEIDLVDKYRTETRCLDDDGMAICFACCKQTPAPPFTWLDDDVPPRALEEEVKKETVMSKRPCSWLADDGRCNHYDDRPAVCKEFEVGGRDCDMLRSLDGQQKV